MLQVKNRALLKGAFCMQPYIGSPLINAEVKIHERPMQLSFLLPA